MALIWFFVLFFVTLLVRRERIAAVIVLALGVVYHVFVLSPGQTIPWWTGLMGAFMIAPYLFVALRFGLLPFTIGMFVHWTILAAPITIDWSTWYAWNSAVPMVVLVVLAMYGFVTSIAGRPSWGARFLGEA